MATSQENSNTPGTAGLYAPNGQLIVGTLERVSGVALILEGTSSRAADGTLNFEYAGDTEIWWEEQKTVTRKGKRVFICEGGDEWTEDQLSLVEADDEPDDDDLYQALLPDGTRCDWDERLRTAGAARVPREVSEPKETA